jgi:hypothetical protein
MRVQHFNDYGKIVSEEGFDNYLHDSGPLFHDTVTNTTTYSYAHDTLLIKKNSAFKAVIDSSSNDYVYDSIGRLIRDSEVRAYRSTGLIIGDSVTTNVDKIAHIYHYGDNGKLSFVEMPDDSFATAMVYYEYDAEGNLTAKECKDDFFVFALTYYEYDVNSNLTVIKEWEDGRLRVGGKAVNLFYLNRLERITNFDGGRFVTVNNLDYYSDDKKQTWFYSCVGNTTAVETEISQWANPDGTWYGYDYVRKYYDLGPTKRLKKEERSNFYTQEATVIYEYR